MRAPTPADDGLPDEVRLITVGQEYVTDGQTVKPVPEEPGSTS